MTSETEGQRTSLRGPILGTVLFVALVPGTVIGWLPHELSDGWSFGAPFFGLTAMRWLGVALMLAAAPIFIDFVVRFVREGFGTPAPIAPPRKLVVRGTFEYSRNPGYVAVVALVVGQAFLFGSLLVLLYATCLSVVFHLFVVFYEEPDLRARFGESYDDYCRRVPRWFPRFSKE
jgi:protein-S-isoprenylcysteine O-methyltransferase Ste14